MEYIGNDRSHFVEWLRLPGDLVFILFGSLPLAIAAIKAYLGIRTLTGGR
jgi:nitric oxide reductase subunit B